MTKMISVSDRVYEYLEAKKKDIENIEGIATFNSVILSCVSAKQAKELFMDLGAQMQRLNAMFIEEPAATEIAKKVAYVVACFDAGKLVGAK